MKTLPAALLFLAAAVTLSTPSASQDQQIDEIRIAKGAHKLELVSEGHIIKTYRVAIGPGGAGPKRMEGDKVTPVGTYRIVGRIKGLFHQFMTVSYPNDDDRKRYLEAKKHGDIPAGVGVGGGIGIHGTGVKEWNGVHKQSDWTLGCIALDDNEIDEIAARVKDGTRVVISD
jgi:murein L,D-transpeptidase YafK